MIKSLKRTTVILVTTYTLLFGLSKDQESVLQRAYIIGGLTVADDGMTFEKTISSIALAESSAGKELIGDTRADGELVGLYKSSLGVCQVRLMTAKEVIKKDKFMNKQFSHLLIDNDNMIIKMLLSSPDFNILIASTYIKMNYNRSLHKGVKPLFGTISLYNGGWHNEIYYGRVMKRMKHIEKLEELGLFLK